MEKDYSKEDFIKIFGKTRKELSNMNEQDRDKYIKKRLEDLAGQLKYTMLLKNNETAFDFTTVLDMFSLKDFIEGVIEVRCPDKEKNDFYLKRIIDALYFDTKYTTNLIIPYPTVTAIVKKVTGNQLDFETYMITENNNNFTFLKMELSDNIKITDIPISEEKAREFYNKSSRNKERERLENIFGKGKTKEY